MDLITDLIFGLYTMDREGIYLPPLLFFLFCFFIFHKLLLLVIIRERILSAVDTAILMLSKRFQISVSKIIFIRNNLCLDIKYYMIKKKRENDINIMEGNHH